MTYPKHAHRVWTEAAIVSAEVTNESVVIGDQGTSELVLDLESGSGFGTVEGSAGKILTVSSPKLTFRFTGSSEHRLVIEALRFMADELERFSR